MNLSFKVRFMNPELHEFALKQDSKTGTMQSGGNLNTTRSWKHKKRDVVEGTAAFSGWKE